MITSLVALFVIAVALGRNDGVAFAALGGAVALLIWS